MKRTYCCDLIFAKVIARVLLLNPASRTTRFWKRILCINVLSWCQTFNKFYTNNCGYRIVNLASFAVFNIVLHMLD